MKLIVSSITIVDLTNKEAKRLTFAPGKNLLTSEKNHLGKSVVMKSIYYTLGADVYYPTPITKLNLLTYIDFSLDNHQYRVARLKNAFVVYCDDAFVGLYGSVGAFEEKLSELFKLEINLVAKGEEGTIVRCPPAYYYLPYYVDQENGWAANSYSFDRMTQFDLPQRKNSYFFHLGVLDSSYVTITKQQKTNNKQISVLDAAIKKLRTVVDTLKEGLDDTQMSFDTESLEKAIRARHAEIKSLLGDITKTRTSLIEAEDLKVQKEHEKEVLSKYIKKSPPPVEEPSTASVECPRCGMVFEQSTAQQLEKLYLFESLHDDYANICKELQLLERRIAQLKKKFATKQQRLAEFESSLESDREAYDAYVKSKATSKMLDEYRDQIAANITEIERLRSENLGISKQLSVYGEEKDSINTSYLGHLGALFTGLDVPADQIADYSEPGSALIASGAYGPRCKIAQVLAFVETQRTNAPELITFPIVIDSPNVLEQDDEHLDAVIRTLLTWSKTDNQIIIASIQGKETAEELGNVNIITLTNEKNHLFNSSEYAEYEEEISSIFTQF